MQLTERQEEILAFVSGYRRERGIPPSTRAIQSHFGFGSQTTLVRYLEGLVEKGALEQREGGTWEAMAPEIQAIFELPIYTDVSKALSRVGESETEHLSR